MNGTALVVGKGVGRVDAENVVECGENVLRRVGLAFRPFGSGVGFADDLAHAQAAAGKEGETRIPPVSTAVGVAGAEGSRLVPHARRATELTPDEHGHLLVEPPLVQVAKQGVNGTIISWKQLAH